MEYNEENKKKGESKLNIYNIDSYYSEPPEENGTLANSKPDENEIKEWVISEKNLI